MGALHIQVMEGYVDITVHCTHIKQKALGTLYLFGSLIEWTR